MNRVIRHFYLKGRNYIYDYIKTYIIYNGAKRPGSWGETTSLNFSGEKTWGETTRWNGLGEKRLVTLRKANHNFRRELSYAQITYPPLLHGPSMFVAKAKIYGAVYNQSSSTAFDETSSNWSASKSS